MIGRIVIKFDFSMEADTVGRVSKAFQNCVHVEPPVVVRVSIEMKRPNEQFTFAAGEHCEAALKGHSKGCFYAGCVVAAQIQRTQAAPDSEKYESGSYEPCEREVLRPLSVSTCWDFVRFTLEILDKSGDSDMHPAGRAFV